VLPLLRGHRVLIFSNSLGALHLLGLCLGERGHAVDLITGEMTDLEERQQRLDRFNAGRGPAVLLLSTRAMNQGVQLTGADTVVFYDHHDNPQNDKQAEARAYRLTQTKPVLVLRLVTRGTKEEQAMGSWVRQKREVQEWLEFAQLGGASEAARGQPLALDDEGVLRALLLDRRAGGSWEGQWRCSEGLAEAST
jgi:SNF2 family DNA or RNA helicase